MVVRSTKWESEQGPMKGSSGDHSGEGISSVNTLRILS